jgi:hypothetical protein
LQGGSSGGDIVDQQNFTGQASFDSSKAASSKPESLGAASSGLPAKTMPPEQLRGGQSQSFRDCARQQMSCGVAATVPIEKM